MGRAVIAVLALALLPAAPGGAEQPVHTDNIRHVANLELEQRPDLGESLRLATDADFHTYTLVEDGVEVIRDFAFVGTQVNGMQVVDITDPEQPELVAVYECAVAQGDVFIFEREDLGGVFAAYTADVISGQTNFGSRCHQDNGVRPGQYGTFIIDITDPYDPQSVSFVHFPNGTHQVTVHPDNEWLYSSPSGITPTIGSGLGRIEIADISDPSAPGPPQPVYFQTGVNGHDLSFSDDGDRAYVAALTHTVILDTSDPGDPQPISSIVDPMIETHHDAYAWTTDTPLGERTYVFITDELLGAGGNGYCPGGGLHVWDITVEEAPFKVGAFYAPTLTIQEGGRTGTGGLVRCTAHVPQIHDEQALMTIAWFGAGVRVLDLSALIGVTAGTEQTGGLGSGIREIGFFRFPDSDAWAAKTNRIAEDGSFYLYSIDTVRMFDVFHFDPDGQPGAEHGTWVAGSGGPLAAAPGTAPFCTMS